LFIVHVFLWLFFFQSGTAPNRLTLKKDEKLTLIVFNSRLHVLLADLYIPTWTPTIYKLRCCKHDVVIVISLQLKKFVSCILKIKPNMLTL